ncbi:MAG: M6 family metalloprotease domain-containing protein [Candidatus Helarchaeota archaeon]
MKKSKAIIFLLTILILFCYNFTITHIQTDPKRKSAISLTKEIGSVRLNIKAPHLCPPPTYLPNGTPLPDELLIDPKGEFPLHNPGKLKPLSTTVQICVLRVNFSNQAFDPSHNNNYFYNRLFNESNSTSLNYYYREVSYYDQGIGINVKGYISDAYPNSHSYEYWGENEFYQSPYAWDLVVQTIQFFDPIIDYSQFDIDGDQYVDHLFIIHAGFGEEHAPSISSRLYPHHYYVNYKTNDINADGESIYVYDYFMAGEWAYLGVYAHEFGHSLGLPDLYDPWDSDFPPDYEPEWDGIGKWGLMGDGCKLGTPEYSQPCHPCAWSKMSLGWIDPTVTTWNETLVIRNIEEYSTGSCYKLPIPGSTKEYFLIEYRRKIGFDANLPGEGLLIWHIDESADIPHGNDDYTHKLVDLEEGDGDDELDKYCGWGGFDHGDDTDPFYSPHATEFSYTTYPIANKSDGSDSGWNITEISGIGDTMTCHVFNKIGTGGGGGIPGFSFPLIIFSLIGTLLSQKIKLKLRRKFI